MQGGEMGALLDLQQEPRSLDIGEWPHSCRAKSPLAGATGAVNPTIAGRPKVCSEQALISTPGCWEPAWATDANARSRE